MPLALAAAPATEHLEAGECLQDPDTDGAFSAAWVSITSINLYDGIDFSLYCSLSLYINFVSLHCNIIFCEKDFFSLKLNTQQLEQP